ncbi:MAG TPA: hypothetical protein VIR54_09925 [Vicinamibacterales bacterium]
MATDVSVDAVMAELHERVRGRLRERLLSHGASREFDDPAFFADVERILQSAMSTADTQTLLLPELLGDRNTWRLQTAMRYQSHRSSGVASLFIFVKQRVLMPMLRWLFEYSRDNFERQRRVNDVVFACVQELAVENARLRRDLKELADKRQ